MPLSDDALAIRGGILRDVERVVEKVMEAVEDGDGPVLSIWCADAHPGESRDDLILRICQEADFPYKQIQVGTVGDLREALEDLVQVTDDGEPESHYHAVFTNDVASSQVEAFVSALSQPEPNPTGGKR